jgi:hypothetical protein
MKTIGVRVKGGGSNSDSECVLFCCCLANVQTNSTLPSNEREYEAFFTYLVLQIHVKLQNVWNLCYEAQR